MALLFVACAAAAFGLVPAFVAEVRFVYDVKSQIIAVIDTDGARAASAVSGRITQL